MKFVIITALLLSTPLMAQSMYREGSCHGNSCPTQTHHDAVVLSCSQKSRTPFDMGEFDACVVRGDASEPRICGVIRQEGVVRDANEQERARINLVLPCSWTDDEMLAGWSHQPDPGWGCKGFNMSDPGKPDRICEAVQQAGEAAR
jgi:hypothetical protein